VVKQITITAIKSKSGFHTHEYTGPVILGHSPKSMNLQEPDKMVLLESERRKQKRRIIDKNNQKGQRKRTMQYQPIVINNSRIKIPKLIFLRRKGKFK
jgi:hypothetical protein